MPSNFLDPAILFFVFGVFAGLVKSNLEVPQPIAKFLSLYLLMALGLKGGFALSESTVGVHVVLSITLALVLAFLIPVVGYWLLKRFTNSFDAAAMAASYGSVSAVTFVTASQFVESAGHTVGGHMAVAMVLMETPAVLVAVFLANALRHSVRQPAAVASVSAGGAAALGGGPVTPGFGKVLKDSFTDGAHLLLLGALAVGLISGSAGKAMMHTFSADLFKGMLAFFLLDMGLNVARHLGTAVKASPVLLAYAVLAPLVHALLALLLSVLCSLPVGDAALLMILSASASYIVVPAVVRQAIPEANPGLYLGLSLGVTFPFNILIGIPLYTELANLALS